VGLQLRFGRLQAGVRILAVEFKEIHPPRHVVAAFRDVQSAKIEIETLQREAEGFRASEIPRAESEMNQMIQKAVAYHNTATAQANAELAVFQQLYGEYEKNPDLVRQRIRMETFEEVIENVGQLRFVAPSTRVIVSD
jgi:membrane protease subunit HflK